MQELIRRIAQALVDNPKEVSISAVEGSSITVIELSVAKEDIGKIIGKHGCNADAMRTILTAISKKNKKQTILEIIE